MNWPLLMKKFHCLILAAFALVLPAVAEEPSLAFDGARALSLSAANPKRMLMEIDLKVLLRHYEKLKTEIGETEVQLALARAGDQDAVMTDAAKALAAVENDKGATKEDLERARDRYAVAITKELDRLKMRLQVLTELNAMVRKEAEVLAQELAKETAAQTKTSFVQPQS